MIIREEDAGKHPLELSSKNLFPCYFVGNSDFDNNDKEVENQSNSYGMHM